MNQFPPGAMFIQCIKDDHLILCGTVFTVFARVQTETVRSGDTAGYLKRAELALHPARWHQPVTVSFPSDEHQRLQLESSPPAVCDVPNSH